MCRIYSSCHDLVSIYEKHVRCHCIIMELVHVRTRRVLVKALCYRSEGRGFDAPLGDF
jgi:hypothetical protein